MREFSHAGRPERERVDINGVIDRVLRISSSEVGPDARVEKHYAKLPKITASPQQLEQVFLNLIVNAVQATKGSGTVRITTALEAEEVVVRIADDGEGIPGDVAERIFDPFFTTKAVGEGTGLGLSISHQIIQGHGGDIRVESPASGGACFRVSLPASSSASPSSAGNEA